MIIELILFGVGMMIGAWTDLVLTRPVMTVVIGAMFAVAGVFL